MVVVKFISNLKGGLDMSKKSKLILATALFGAALFGASCGGGGGTASAPPPPPPAPSASDVAKVLVLAAKGITSAGATVGLFEGTIRSDGTISWSSDLLPGENRLEYCHEFSNKSVLLCEDPVPPTPNRSIYLYTAGTLNQVTTGVTVSGSSITPTTFPSLNFSGTIRFIYLPNFVVVNRGTSPNVEYIITSNGRIVEMPGTTERLVYAGRDYLVVGNGAASEHVYIIKRDGSVTVLDWNDAASGIQAINNGSVRLLDRVQGTDIILLGHTSTTTANAVYVILEDGTPIRITNSTNASTGDDPVADIDSGKIMRDANGNIFVAINYTDGTNNLIQYFKIIPSGSGSVVFTPPAPIDLGATTNNPLRRGGYALDGSGRLYVITFAASNFNITTRFIDASNSLVTGPTHPLAFSGTPTPVMLAFANGVLVSNNPTSPTALSHVLGINAPTNVALITDLINAVSLCNQVNNTSELILENEPAYSGILQEPVVGEGTNRLMCASANATGFHNQFAWVEASGTGTYNGRRVDNVSGTSGSSVYLMATTNSMIFLNNPPALLSGASSQIFQECTFGASSCTTRNLSTPVYWTVYNPISSSNNNIKIKSDNNVLSDGAGSIYGGYWRGVAPNIRAVYFTTTPSAPYTANIQTGAVDTSTLNLAFSETPARGGNISLELDKVANVVRPISGAQCPSGLFDNVRYKDATNNFTNLARPTNTCLIRVLQVRTP